MTTRSCGAEVLSIALLGLDPHLIHVHATARPGPGSFGIVGLSEAQTRETRVRVRAALEHIGIELTAFNIFVQLTPEALPMSGGCDVAVALAVLGAIGHVPCEGDGD